MSAWRNKTQTLNCSRLGNATNSRVVIKAVRVVKDELTSVDAGINQLCRTDADSTAVSVIENTSHLPEMEDYWTTLTHAECNSLPRSPFTPGAYLTRRMKAGVSLINSASRYITVADSHCRAPFTSKTKTTNIALCKTKEKQHA